MNKHETMMKQIEKHGLDLLAIYPNATEKDPVKLCKKLLKIERAARQFATDYCNGEINPCEDSDIDAKVDGFKSKIDEILGDGPAIMINLDCRGCALKIDSDVMKAENVNLYRDFGGNGLICPTFDGSL